MDDASGPIIDNLIVGTGHAGIAAAMALRQEGKSFEVVDVGFDLPEPLAKRVDKLRSQTPAQWASDDVAKVFPPVEASVSGVEPRPAFGSDFVYRQPPWLHTNMENCDTRLSHGLGGFGNVWGAAMMPYSARSMASWPVPREELTAAYRRVLDFVPLSGERDELDRDFPLFTDRFTALDRSGWSNSILQALGDRRDGFQAAGVTFGRARLAVDSSGGEDSCRYCGHCLDGCPYDAIANPRSDWQRLELAGTPIHRGEFVLEFEEHDDGVRVITRDVADGRIRTRHTRRLFLAAGHVGTTRLILSSLRRFDEPVRIADSQYFFFPLLAYRAIKDPSRFTLAEAFAEIANDEISSHDVHVQIYGMNPIFLQAMRRMLPRPFPLGWIARRFFLVQGFLHSTESGHLELEVHSAPEGESRMTLRGVTKRRTRTVAAAARRLLSRQLRGFGFAPPGLLQVVPPGRSFHGGASFPMGATDPVYSSDTVGRPAGLRHTHIVDSACFPDVAGCTIGFTIMANADRIVRTAVRGG